MDIPIIVQQEFQQNGSEIAMMENSRQEGIDKRNAIMYSLQNDSCNF